MLGGWLDAQQGRVGGVDDPHRPEPHSHRGGAATDLEGAGDLVGCRVTRPLSLPTHSDPSAAVRCLATTPTGISASAPSASVGTVSALRLVARSTRTIGCTPG